MCVSLVVLIASGARVIIASTEAYSVVTNQQSGVISYHPTTRTVPKYSAALCCSLSVTSWWNHKHCAVLCTPEVFDVCVCVCLELERKPKQQPKTKKKAPTRKPRPSIKQLRKRCDCCRTVCSNTPTLIYRIPDQPIFCSYK